MFKICPASVLFLHGWSSPLALSASDAAMEECNLIQSAARYVERLAAETFGELVSEGQIVSVETWFAAIYIYNLHRHSFSCLHSDSIIFHLCLSFVLYIIIIFHLSLVFLFLFCPTMSQVLPASLQEWWAHSRPSGSGSGHQLHYDLDEVDLKTLKVRRFFVVLKGIHGPTSFRDWFYHPGSCVFSNLGPRHRPHQSTQ